MKTRAHQRHLARNARRSQRALVGRVINGEMERALKNIMAAPRWPVVVADPWPGVSSLTVEKDGGDAAIVLKEPLRRVWLDCKFFAGDQEIAVGDVTAMEREG